MSWFIDLAYLVHSKKAQTTVEAAFIIPLLMIVVLLLIQPGILLYNRIVMQGAAADGCRMLATSTDEMGSMEQRCEDLIRRHLGAIPQQELFHVHDGTCSWEIECEGSDTSSSVSVTIRNKVVLMPLINIGAGFMGLTDDRGMLTQQVQVSMDTYASWVSNNEKGLSPETWSSNRLE